MRNFMTSSLIFTVLVCACAVEDPSDSSTGAEGSEDSESSTSQGVTQGETDTEDTDTGPGCDEDGAATFSFSVTLPPLDPPANEEAGEDERSATCIVDVITTVGNTSTLELTCDEDGGPADQPYLVEFIMPEGETLTLTEGAEVALDYERWWGFEVGGSTRIALSEDGDVVLLAYRSSTLGNQCALSSDTVRASADTWLGRVNGHLLDANCEATPGRLAADFGNALPVVHVGQVTTIPSGQRMVLEQAICFEMEGFAIAWDTGFAVWTDT